MMYCYDKLYLKAIKKLDSYIETIELLDLSNRDSYLGEDLKIYD